MNLGAGVGQAVAEIQARPVLAAFAVALESGDGDMATCSSMARQRYLPRGTRVQPVRRPSSALARRSLQIASMFENDVRSQNAIRFRLDLRSKHRSVRLFGEDLMRAEVSTKITRCPRARRFPAR